MCPPPPGWDRVKPDRGDLLKKGLLLGYIVIMVNVNKAGIDKKEGVQTVWEEGKW